MLTRDAILAAVDRPTTPVEVPEWGGTVHVRTMSGAERDAYESELFIKKGSDLIYNRANVRARLLVRVLVDESGQRLFTDADIDALGAKSAPVLERLFQVALKQNGLSPGDVAELEKN